jgi:uncharacterized membrane protein YqaE (UPF0057 family)
MKQTNLLSLVAVSMIAVLLFSCSPSANEGFAKRKYFDYKWDKKEYAKVEPRQPSTAEAHKAEVVSNEEATVQNTGSEIEPVVMNEEKPVTIPSKRVKEIPAEKKAPVMGAKEGKPSFTEKVIVKQLDRFVEKKQEQDKRDEELLLLIILAIILPPVPVAILRGVGTELLISILLTLLLYLPGLIYALYIIFEDK